MSTTPLTLLHSAVSGLLARQYDIDTAADNLANVNTPGFKPSRADFQELLAPDAPDGEVAGPYRGTGLAVTRRSVTPGPLIPGASPLELAIQGDGFFQIRLPDGGAAYTRDGRFSLDGEGRLVTAGGYRAVIDGTLPTDAEALHVNPDGTVMAQSAGAWTQVATLRTVRFANPAGLLNRGDNLLETSANSGEAGEGTPGQDGFGQIISGAIEQSATDLGAEMAGLIIAQRAYSLSLKAFQQADEMISLAIRLRSG